MALTDSSPATATNTRNQRVLVVEDNELNSKLFRDLLRAQNYEPIVTAHGLEAMGLARKHNPALILLDIQLPEVSGREVLRWFKDDPELRIIPVVAVTAFALEGDEEKLLALGFDAYLSKPISVERLMLIVRRFIPQEP
jgi:two-component system, cell cycle response regulator DivK